MNTSRDLGHAFAQTLAQYCKRELQLRDLAFQPGEFAPNLLWLLLSELVDGAGPLVGGEHLCNRTSVPARSTPCARNKRLLRPGQLCSDCGKAGGEDVVSDLLDNSVALGPHHLEVSPPLREGAVALGNAM